MFIREKGTQISLPASGILPLRLSWLWNQGRVPDFVCMKSYWILILRMPENPGAMQKHMYLIHNNCLFWHCMRFLDLRVLILESAHAKIIWSQSRIELECSKTRINVLKRAFVVHIFLWPGIAKGDSEILQHAFWAKNRLTFSNGFLVFVVSSHSAMSLNIQFRLAVASFGNPL